MDEQFKSARTIFGDAVGIANPAERDAYLAHACGSDAGLRQKVDDLLSAHAAAGNFLVQKGESNAAPVVREKPGDRIGRYKLIEQIGHGGHGVVYLAEQEEPVRRRVAVKLVKEGMDTRSVLARFEAERQALALMDHPNIARVFDAGATESGRPYFVMELVRGVRITEYCDQNSLSAPERLALFIQVCQAIQHAHQKGIIHRDIKPSNILVTVNDGLPVPKVIDFGIAKAVEEKPTDEALVTKFFEFLGTPVYMSPEQSLMTSLDIDTRSDVYSLGVLLYELLTGKTPFDAKELIEAGLDEMRRMIREKDPARPSSRLLTLTAAEQTTTAQRRRTQLPKLIQILSGDLDWIVMKSLEKDRNRRYQTPAELAADIQHHLRNEPVSARPPSRLYLVQKLVRRRRGAFAAATAVMLALAAGLATTTWVVLRETATRHREAATRQISELGQADLASRSGRWRDALVHWDAAERAGRRDDIGLGQRRAEAYLVLHDRDKAGAEFEKLMRLPDLGSRSNAIQLRIGEFQMFSSGTFQQGAQRVREALTNGLNAPDEWLAKGLLTDSTTNALACFRQALELDPYLHSAHRHSLGLEFALGRHDELASHLRVAKALYPGDFSPGAIEVCELALHGRLRDAQAALAQFRPSISVETYTRMERGVRLLFAAVEYFDVEVYLGERTNTVGKAELLSEATQLFLSRGMGDATNAARGPLPQLPCIEQGLGAAFNALKELSVARVLGGVGRTDDAIAKLIEGCRHHPEALFPTFAGTLLDGQQPRTGSRDARLLALQSKTYQLGADLPSILPNLGRLARFLATDVQEELSRGAQTNATAVAYRTQCVANLRRAALDPLLTPIECRNYSRWSHNLGEHDLDRQILARWESLRPDDTSLLRHRIRLELASAAYGPALKLIERALTANPEDAFAKAEKEKALREVRNLNESVH